MSFYCKRYQNKITHRKAFDYCMKRLPNGGKCNDLEETKKGGKKCGNASMDRHGNGHRVLRRQARIILASYEQEHKEMDP